MSAFASPRLTLDAAILTNVSECRVSRREKAVALGQDGNLHVSQRTIMRAAPVIEFATGDLKALLTKLSNAESPAYTIAGAGVTAIIPQIIQNGLGFAAGSAHTLFTALNGLVTLDRLSWSEGGMAVANGTVHARSTDGTTDPMPGTTTTAPAQGAVGAEFILQSLTVGGTPLTDCTRFDLSCGHQVSSEAAACYTLGLPYPTAILGAGALGAASFELTLEILDELTNFSNGAVVAVFKRKTANSIALHSDQVTITLNTALVMAGDHAGGSPGSRTLKCLATHDGTNRPLTVALA